MAFEFVNIQKLATPAQISLNIERTLAKWHANRFIESFGDNLPAEFERNMHVDILEDLQKGVEDCEEYVELMIENGKHWYDVEHYLSDFVYDMDFEDDYIKDWIGKLTPELVDYYKIRIYKLLESVFAE